MTNDDYWKLILKNLSDYDIASVLNINLKTVRNYRKLSDRPSDFLLDMHKGIFVLNYGVYEDL
jgi:hypothetical protein